MTSPKESRTELKGKELEKAIGKERGKPHSRRRFRVFFNNEYYPALIPVRDVVIKGADVACAIATRRFDLYDIRPKICHYLAAKHPSFICQVENAIRTKGKSNFGSLRHNQTPQCYF